MNLPTAGSTLFPGLPTALGEDEYLRTSLQDLIRDVLGGEHVGSAAIGPRSLVELLRAASAYPWLPEALAQGEPVPAVSREGPSTSIQLLPLGSFGAPSCSCSPTWAAGSVGKVNGVSSDPSRVRLAELVAALSSGSTLVLASRWSTCCASA